MMKPRLLFALRVILISAIFFLIWPLVSVAWAAAFTANLFREIFGTAPTGAVPDKSYLLIPTLSVIVAASGAEVRRKLNFALLAFACQFGFSVLSLATGIQGLSEHGGGISDSFLGSMALMIRYSMPWMLAIFIILLYIDGSPNILWSPTGSRAAGR